MMDAGRRRFLKGSASTAIALTAAERLRLWASPRTVLGANDRVRVAIVGLRGRGESHIHEFGALPNVEIAALCDVDDSVLRERLAQVQKMGFRPRVFSDVRKLLEDRSIDAISIATPHHWHALIAIWACQAGKDVYVEKPCSHNLWEGRQLVLAAQKYNRIVQHGTQGRSSPAVRNAIEKMRKESLLGDVYLSRGLCFKWRDTIGHTPVSPVPAGVDYDMWTGPAPLLPFTRNHFHYNWHWFWNYGNGDLGNQGIHQMDIARWGLGLGFPNRVSSVGAHVMFDDDQQTPNILNTVFEYDLAGGKRAILEFEVRHWITNHEAEIGLARPAGDSSAEVATGGLGPVEGSYNTIGNTFFGPKGYLAIDNVAGYRAWFGREQKQGASIPDGPNDHFANFIACIVSRDQQALRAPIEEGHISSGLAHLANASYRLGRSLVFDPDSETVKGDEEANRLLRGDTRGYRAPFVLPQKI